MCIIIPHHITEIAPFTNTYQYIYTKEISHS